MSRKQTGLTLLELLITLALAALIVSIGLPSLTLALQTARTTSQINEINTFVQLARAEALKVGQPALVIPAGGDWTDEWRLGIDTNNDNDITGAEILQRMPGLPDASITVIDDDGDAVNAFGFQPNGWLFNVNPIKPERNPSPVAFTLLADDCLGSNQRVLRIERGGGTSGVQRQTCP